MVVSRQTCNLYMYLTSQMHNLQKLKTISLKAVFFLQQKQK